MKEPPPAAPYAVSAPQTAEIKPAAHPAGTESPVLPIDSSNHAPVSNTGDADGQDAPDGKAADTVSIIGVGDIMLGSNYPVDYLPDTNILKNVESVLQDADITVGNLEGTLFDEGGTPKKCANPKICYAFRTPSAYGQYLTDAGFDYLSLANNHSNDFGAQGITATAGNLDELNIKYSGIENRFETAILKKNGVRYGFVSFAPNLAAVKLNDYAKVRKLITKTKQKADIVIVMFHGGAEGKQAEHLPFDTEIFYGENRGNVVEFARLAVDSGADVVFGQGPHVTRAVELYRDRFIPYSGGNFATYGAINTSGISGIAPIFKIITDKQGKFISGTIIPITQADDKIPKIDPEKPLSGGLFI
ncbi:TPA: CapA family protein [Neisseria meningitidis]|uniref:CapA family protein n=1 Tax=Neisseria meningitidis TaxID=487 RepID=UPI00026875F2|nr:CapA family protein [Neisseria meningitidis]CCI72761.1 Capsule biosynthesis protein capA [Neisseria meningitidis alpha704]